MTTPTTDAQRTWTVVGHQWTHNGERNLDVDSWPDVYDPDAYHEKRGRQPLVEKAIAALEWETVEGDKPMMPALSISECIKQLRLPRVSQVAISSDLAPYGFYGIESRYSNGRARVYVLDQGGILLPLASDFWPDE